MHAEEGYFIRMNCSNSACSKERLIFVTGLLSTPGGWTWNILPERVFLHAWDFGPCSTSLKIYANNVAKADEHLLLLQGARIWEAEVGNMDAAARLCDWPSIKTLDIKTCMNFPSYVLSYIIIGRIKQVPMQLRCEEISGRLCLSSSGLLSFPFCNFTL